MGDFHGLGLCTCEGFECEGALSFIVDKLAMGSLYAGSSSVCRRVTAQRASGRRFVGEFQHDGLMVDDVVAGAPHAFAIGAVLDGCQMCLRGFLVTLVALSI